MKQVFLLIIYVCFSMVLITQNKEDHSVLVLAHRGDWRNAPENSLKAYQNCIDQGIEMIEIDLSMSKDGYIVIMHDVTLGRTTNRKGKVSDIHWQN